LGRTALTAYTRERSTPQGEFLATIDQRLCTRVPGTAVFLTSLAADIPLILEHHIERIHVLHQRVVLLTIAFEHVPYVAPSERVEVAELDNGFVRVIAHYGYMDQPDVPAVLGAAG